MNTKIIQADISHAAIIATIGKKSFRNAFEHLFRSKEELFEYLEYAYEPVKLAKSLRKENNVYLLAYRGSEPVGFAKIKKHSLNDQIESLAQMELQKIYTLPEHQGRGAGSALLKEVKNLAKEISPDHIWLDTHISNEKAIRFYEKNGFKKISKYFFTIGTQTFEYYVMGLPVSLTVAV
ncbi:MAG: GNAT family N-acetyltransferase [Chitinophagaceae bacterium]